MKRLFVLATLVLLTSTPIQPLFGQSLGNAGTIEGTVVDPSGALIATAEVTLHNPVSGYMQSATTGTDGAFRLVNIPTNIYDLEVKASGFGTSGQDVTIRNSVPIQVKTTLAVAGANTSIT